MESFLELMQFPQEWLEWGMYPDELFEMQMRDYQPGQEQASEHTRYGAIHWWIAQDPWPDKLSTLFALTYLDGDQPMAADARRHLRSCSCYDEELERGGEARLCQRTEGESD